jgi:hypothetical protein
MPSPNSPPSNQILTDILTAIVAQGVEIAALTVAVSAQQDDIEKLANYARYDSESTYGPNVDIANIWSDTDRYA